jgi:hypothetical protein
METVHARIKSLLMLNMRNLAIIYYRGSADRSFQAPPRKRKRPVAPTAGTPFRSKGRLGSVEDALESTLLTSKVWDELVSHFSRYSYIC